jgi:hypothetical protein
MKMPETVIYKIFLLGAACWLSGTIYGYQPPDSLSGRSIKLDLASYYGVLFDGRKQIRLGLEYQGNSHRKHFASLHVDAGLYDDYDFYKYYDFFNQTDGFHHQLKNVKTYGFHLMPAWNYRLSRKDSKKRVQGMTGLTADLDFFEKRTKSYNSLTGERSKDIYIQERIAIGGHLGMHIRIGRRIGIEIKNILMTRVVVIRPKPAKLEIQPFNAIKLDEGKKFWLVPQVQVCYAF